MVVLFKVLLVHKVLLVLLVHKVIKVNHQQL